MRRGTRAKGLVLLLVSVIGFVINSVGGNAVALQAKSKPPSDASKVTLAAAHTAAGSRENLRWLRSDSVDTEGRLKVWEISSGESKGVVVESQGRSVAAFIDPSANLLRFSYEGSSSTVVTDPPKDERIDLGPCEVHLTTGGIYHTCDLDDIPVTELHEFYMSQYNAVREEYVSQQYSLRRQAHDTVVAAMTQLEEWCLLLMETLSLIAFLVCTAVGLGDEEAGFACSAAALVVISTIFRFCLGGFFDPPWGPAPPPTEPPPPPSRPPDPRVEIDASSPLGRVEVERVLDPRSDEYWWKARATPKPNLDKPVIVKSYAYFEQIVLCEGGVGVSESQVRSRIKADAQSGASVDMTQAEVGRLEAGALESCLK